MREFRRIKDWLTNSRQRVIINGEASAWVQINSDVPRGYVLATIYVNNLDLI